MRLSRAEIERDDGTQQPPERFGHGLQPKHALRKSSGLDHRIDKQAKRPQRQEGPGQAVEPVHQIVEPAPAIRAEFGDRLALWGTVGTANTWDHGSPADIRREVGERLTTLGGAGLLLAPAYDVDFTPLANLNAFVQAVRG